jgi:subtilisin family serine protease
MMRKQANILIFLICLLTLSFYGCEDTIYDQVAGESFANGKLPNMLEQLVNPNYINKFKNKINAAIEASKNNFRIKVAVIDGGTDIYHPQLIEKLAWKKNSLNQIELLGYDFMGEDSNPSPEFAKYDLFAYGAEKIEDNKIVNPPENPLIVLDLHNKSFMNALLSKLGTHPTLRNSIFAKKINKKNLTIFGAEALIAHFDIDRYEKSKKDGYLISEAIFNMPNDKWNKLRSEASHSIKNIYYALYRKTWNMSLNHGTPYDPYESSTEFSSYSMLYNIAYADQFIELLKETIKTFPLSKEFESSKKTYKEYFVTRNSSKETLDEEFDYKLTLNLSKALIFFLYPPQINTFSVELINSLETLIVAEQFEKNEKFPSDFFITKDMVNETLLNLENKFNSIITYSIQNQEKYLDFSSADKKDLAKIENHTDSLKKIKNNFLNKYNLTQMILDHLQNKLLKSTIVQLGQDNNTIENDINPNGNISNLILRQNQNDIYQNDPFIKFIAKSTSPFLESKGINYSHGTHTAGVIANNNPDVQIVPIRVLTQTMKWSKTRAEKIKETFKAKLLTWLQEPIVFKGLSKKFENAIEIEKADWNDHSKKNIANIAEKLLKIWNDKINNKVDNYENTLVFSDEFINAIKYCGVNKIKIASISLGMEYEKQRERTAAIEENDDVDKAFDFILMEYYKWTFASTMINEAPGTLFVVALGNSNSWVNGTSRSALPVDLSSKFLLDLNVNDKFESISDAQRIAPNNHINQILAVGSTDSNREFSDFTNVIIKNKKIPQVFFIGENVNSSIKTFDSSGYSQLRKRYLSFIDVMNVSTSNKNLLDTYILENKLKTNFLSNDTKNKNNARDLLIKQLEVYESIFQPALIDLFVNHQMGYGHMDGTSMATPGVARQVSIWTAGLAKQYKLLDDDKIYNDPRLTPKKLIQMTQNKSILEDGYYFIPKDPTWEVPPKSEELKLIDIFSGFIKKDNANKKQN